jgi:hypothetical protein
MIAKATSAVVAAAVAAAVAFVYKERPTVPGILKHSF